MPVTSLVLSASALLQRGTDVCVFVFITGSVASGSSLGIRDRLTLVIFAVTWLSAAVNRVVACRSGKRPALRFEPGDTRAAMVLAFGAGPWMALGILQAAFPTLALWAPLPVPPSVYAVGLALAAGSIAEPFLFRDKADAHARDTFSWQEYRRGLLRSLGILLLSGSLVIAVLCVLWLAVTLWHSHAPAVPDIDVHRSTSATPAEALS